MNKLLLDVLKHKKGNIPREEERTSNLRGIQKQCPNIQR